MGAIPAVDPVGKQAPFTRLMRATIKTPAGSWAAEHLIARVDPLLLKASGGRVKVAVGFPAVNLTTTGAKSGQPRTATVLYFTRGSNVILIASKFGATRNPAWYHNLKAHPQATLTVKGHEGTYTAREATGAEREELYALAEKMYGGYANYKTKAGSRTIPVMVLSPD